MSDQERELQLQKEAAEQEQQQEEDDGSGEDDDGEEEEEAGGGASGQIVISPETAQLFEDVKEAMHRPVPEDMSEEAVFARLQGLIEKLKAPVALKVVPGAGVTLVTTRNIAEGEVIYTEEAIGLALSKGLEDNEIYVMTQRVSGQKQKEGEEAVHSAAAAGGAGAEESKASSSSSSLEGPQEEDSEEVKADPPILVTLPPWPTLRTIRDSFTVHPRYQGQVEEAFLDMFCLTAYNSRRHAGEGWGHFDQAVLQTPKGIPSEEPLNAVPARAQLTHAIIQCNAFATSMPEEDSDWLRGTMWPLLLRLQCPEDRERMFDSEQPLSLVSAVFGVSGLINHSCLPNCNYSSQWEEGAEFPCITVKAEKNLPAGSEICFSYVQRETGVMERRRKLLLTYRFLCCCDRCKEELTALGKSVEAQEEKETATGGAGAGAAGAKESKKAELQSAFFQDPLRHHFPLGLSLDGLLSFYALGGQYPTDK